MDPDWAAARGADNKTKMPTRIAVSKTDLLRILMLHSPFHEGAWSGNLQTFFGPLSLLLPSYSKRVRSACSRHLCCPVFPYFLMSFLHSLVLRSPRRRNHSAVRNRIRRTCLGKGPQSQPAAVARAAPHLFILIARPRQVQRGPQLQAALDDLALLHGDDWCHHCDLR